MNPQIPAMVAVAAVVFVLIVFIGIWVSRYVKVGPNQVLVVSGRKVHLPDGRMAGFRIVKGGGTFVFPVIERVDVLSLEIITVELPRFKARAAGGHAVEADAVAQLKIGGDDASIAAAAAHFLNRKPVEIRYVVQPVLEQHLCSVLAGLPLEEATQNPTACAAQVAASASGDLSKLGLNLIGFALRDARAA